MTRVLILDSDATLTSAVARCLGEVGLEVLEHHRADTVNEALRAGAFDVVLLDWAYTDLVEHLDERKAIVMVAYAGPDKERELARRFTLLRKPFTSVELLSVLDQEVGPLSLRRPQLLDALRAAHSQRRTVRLMCANGGESAEVVVVDGEIHDARHDDLRGERALRALLERPLAVREGVMTASTERTVRRPWRKLLLDLLGQIDAAEQLEQSSGYSAAEGGEEA